MRFGSTLSFFLTLLVAATANEDDSVFLWSSTGGGWRAMFASAGFSNLFQQAGLFTQDESKFRSIATNSGSSWFSTQLFYSQAFYNQTVMAPTPDHLFNFTIDWMSSYHDLAIDAQEYRQNLLRKLLKSDVDVMALTRTLAEIELGINFTALFPPGEPVELEYNPLLIFLEFYDLYRYSEADWGNFMLDMLTRATEAIGHEGDFASIIANSENRLNPLAKTDLVIQTTISPQSKLRLSSADYNITETIKNYGDTNLTGEWEYLRPIFGDLEKQDMAVYLGPFYDNQTENSTINDWEVFSESLSAYYLVNDTFEGFQYATHNSDSTSTLASYVSPTSFRFRWGEREGYYLWPNDGFWGHPTDPALSITGATLQAAYNNMAQNMTATGTMQDPFGGGAANVIQAASVSSAAAAAASPGPNPVFSQSLSLMRQVFIEELPPLKAIAALTAFDLAVQQLDESVLLDNFAVCSQWPNPCGPNDGYFLDGVYADNPSVVSNIAQYQNSADADLNKTIKLVITNTNQMFESNTSAPDQFLHYFQTDWNQNVMPGGYVWRPTFTSPYLSPQIFEEYLTGDDLVAAQQPFEGYNHTTATLSGTTIANPAFGIKPGQKVEILMINTNEDIPTTIVGLQLIEGFTIPMASMAYNLAANDELVARIHDFFFGDDEDDGSVVDTETEAGDDMEDAADNSTETEGPPAGEEQEEIPDAEISKAGPLPRAGAEELKSAAHRSGAGVQSWLVAIVATAILLWNAHQ